MAQCSTETFVERSRFGSVTIKDPELRAGMREAFRQGLCVAHRYVAETLKSHVLDKDLVWRDEARALYPDPTPERRVIRLPSDGHLARVVNPGQEPLMLETVVEGALHWFPLYKVHPKDVLLVADLIRNPLEASK